MQDSVFSGNTHASQFVANAQGTVRKLQGFPVFKSEKHEDILTLRLPHQFALVRDTGIAGSGTSGSMKTGTDNESKLLAQAISSGLPESAKGYTSTIFADHG